MTKTQGNDNEQGQDEQQQQGQAAGVTLDVARLETEKAKAEEAKQKSDEKAAKAVQDAARYRDQLRAMMGTVQGALGLEQDKGLDGDKSWADRITGLEERITKALGAQVGTIQEQLDAEKEARMAAELTTQKLSIGAEMGLPPEIAQRLQGEDEEALRKDAEELRKAMPKGALVSPMNPATGGGDAVSEMAQRLYKRNRGPGAIGLFTPEGNEGAGGGVGDLNTDR